MNEQKRQGYLDQKLADKPASTVDKKVYISSLKLLSERDAEIDRLRTALAEANATLDKADVHTEMLMVEIERLKTEASAAVEAHIKMYSELLAASEANRAALAEAQAVLVVKDDRNSKLQSELVDANSRTCAWQGECEQLRVALAEAERERDRARAERDEAYTDAIAARESHVRLVEQTEDMRHTLSAAERERDEWREQNIAAIVRGVARAERAEAALAAARGVLERWLRHADRGNWRDKTGLSLSAAPIVDDTRAFLERTATSPDPFEPSTMDDEAHRES